MSIHHRVRLSFLLTVLGLSGGSAFGAAPDSLVAVGIQDVTINDGFWSPKIGLWSSVTINDTFDKFEQYGGFTNFDRVAQGLTGNHAGEPWWDGLIYETIRAAGDFLSANPDPALQARVDAYIVRIKAAAAHDPDGYVNTAQQLNNIGYKWKNPPTPGDNHDDDFPHTIYNAGCLVEAAIHYHRATGDTELLKIATRMANYMCGIMGPAPKLNIIPGHALSEETFVNLYQLYRDEPDLKAAVGLPVNEQDYLNLAQFWIENRGNTVGRVSKGSYNQDDISVFLQPTLQGHAVRSVLLASGMAVAGRENSRADYRQTLERWWQNMVDARMYVTGGLGAVAAYEGFGADYELPHDGYAETCASAACGLFSHNMNLLTGNAKYVDTLERELYNGALSGVSLQGDTYFYTNPMSSEPNHRRWEWAGAGLPLTPCCPPMFLKLTSALPSMIYATKGSTVYVNLYVGSQASIRTQSLDLGITQTTGYPWNGTMNFTIHPAAPSTFTVKFRVPGWSGAPEFRINGELASGLAVTDGYATVTRQWQAGDTVGLTLPMPVKRVKSDERVKADRGRVALMRGPVVYCFEGLDNSNAARGILMDEMDAFTATYQPDLLGGVVQLKARTSIVRNLGDTLRREPFTARAVPFFANKNRDDTTMDVWVADATSAVRPVVAGIPSASYVNPGDSVIALNDGIVPRSSDDENVPRMTWWNHKGTSEWVQLTYNKSRTISTVGVYWWDERRVNRECRVPQSWSVQYLSGGQWLPVQGASSYGVAMDQFNRVNFTPVETTAIRVVAQLQSGWSAGILEMYAGTRPPAVPTASHTFAADTVNAFTDGRIPAASDDESIPRQTYWDHKGSAEWAQLTFAAARKLSSLEIYWWDERRLNRDCRVPQSWSVQYLSNGQWLPVQTQDTYGTAMDTFNTVRFAEVETTAIRVALQIQSGWSAGILEMCAYEPDFLTPAQSWLVERGLDKSTSLLSDTDGDGISLLTAYALGLEPDRNPVNAMPSPALSGGSLGMTFWGARADVKYAAETSTDLR
ncbi:MAG: hypothetical protein EOP85_01480, partial [Verrucomicrobiaceae bacterium]